MYVSSATLGGRRYSQTQFDVQSESRVQSDLEGWDAVEDHLQKFDERMIKKLDDDVNTLLVFAGLFSAVLTAFLIDSYKWLKEDNEESNTQILTQISTQLSSFVVSLPFFNSTQPAASESFSQFHPNADAIIINIFWFLSLVLSLTAALYGMMVKQWMREYMEWTTYSSPSYDVVYLRQVRFEAWKTWKVNWIVATIPGLLEIALILFLCGILYLLWTLNEVVAIILTVVVMVFILLVFAATVLPAFIRQCPYKSPVGWACTVAWGAINRRITGRNTGLYARFPDWRRRDMFLVGLGIDEPLLEESTDAKPASGDTVPSVLARTLDWVRRDSQDPELLAHINKCTNSLHGQSFLAVRLNKKLLMAFLNLCCELGLDIPITSSCFKKDYSSYNKLGPQTHTTYASSLRSQAASPTFWLDTIAENPIDLSPKALYATSLVEDLRSYLDLLAGRSTSVHAPIQYAVGILCFFYRSNFGKFTEEQPAFWSMLIDYYNDNYDNEQMDKAYPGFRSFIFQLLCRIPIENVVLGEDVAINLHDEFLNVGHHPARIACKLFKSGLYNAEDRHNFVLTVDMALQCITEDYTNTHPDVLKRLFASMSEALRVAIVNNWANCGSYAELPWAISLLASLKKHPDPSSILYLLPLSLLDRLREARTKGLVKDEATETALVELKNLWGKYATRISFDAIQYTLNFYTDTLGASTSPSNLAKFAEAADYVLNNIWAESLTHSNIQQGLHKMFQYMSIVLQIPFAQHPTQDYTSLRAIELAWINTLYAKARLAKYAPFISLIPPAFLKDLQRLWEDAGRNEEEWHFMRLRRICIKTQRKESGDTMTDIDIMSPVSPSVRFFPTPITTTSRRKSWNRPSLVGTSNAAFRRSIPTSRPTPPSTPTSARKSWPLASFQAASSSTVIGGSEKSKPPRKGPPVSIMIPPTILERNLTQSDEVESSQRESPTSVDSAQSGFFTPSEIRAGRNYVSSDGDQPGTSSAPADLE